MAAITNSYKTYTAVGVREDLQNIVYNIDPFDTPGMTAIGRSKATQPLHEWLVDSLAAQDTANSQLEGYLFEGVTLTPATRKSTYCQISHKPISISGTNMVVDAAGETTGMAYQLAKAGKELKRDMEGILFGIQGQNAGAAGTARKTRGLLSWLETNDDRATNGAAATASTATPTDGTQRAFTETILKNILLLAYNSGSDANMVLMGGFQKQQASAFSGRVSSRQAVNEDTILGAASIYSSDFGDIRLVPDRHIRTRDAILIDPEKLKIAYLRPMAQRKMGTVGDGEQVLINVEYALEVCNEKAHGVAADLTTS